MLRPPDPAHGHATYDTSRLIHCTHVLLQVSTEGSLTQLMYRVLLNDLIACLSQLVYNTGDDSWTKEYNMGKTNINWILHKWDLTCVNIYEKG